jgi:hypothetical protein
MDFVGNPEYLAPPFGPLRLPVPSAFGVEVLDVSENKRWAIASIDDKRWKPSLDDTAGFNADRYHID